jgi:dynein heavy chain
LIRQIHDYSLVYDRDNLEEYNKLQDLYFCACLNPKAGSFAIELRLQRHFSVFTLPGANENIIKSIYKQIMVGHFKDFEGIGDLPEKLVEATLVLFKKILMDPQFAPSSVKFYYNFNLRELSKVTEGVMLSVPHYYKNNKFKILKLWAHECRRVFCDRLIMPEDIEKFGIHLAESYKSAADGA